MIQENRFLPILGLGLHFCSTTLYLAAMAVGREAVPLGMVGAKFHFAAASVFAFLLSWLLSRQASQTAPANSDSAKKQPALGTGRFLAMLLPSASPLARFLIALLCGVALLSLFWGFSLTPERVSGAFFLIWPFATVSVCWPVGLWLYFRAVPANRQGLLLALPVASIELVWIGLLPVLSVFLANPAATGLIAPDLTLHLFKILGIFQAGSCLCFAAALVWESMADSSMLPQQPERTPERMPEQMKDAPRGTGTPALPIRALLLLYAAGAAYFAMFGMTFNAQLPRAVMPQEAPRLLHFFLLASVPLAGLLVDASLRGSRGAEGRTCPVNIWMRRLLAALALAALAVPALAFLDGGALSDPLFGFMNLTRATLLILLFVSIFRLTRGGPWYPLLGSLAYSLYLLQFAGTPLGREMLRRFGQPGLVMAEALLALVFAFCLFMFYRWLTGRREQTCLLEPDCTADEAKDAEAARLEALRLESLRLEAEAKRRAFSAFFGFSAREDEVLGGIVRGLSLEAIGAELGISERTVKYHITGLLTKTAQGSRQRLLHFYTGWNAG